MLKVLIIDDEKAARDLVEFYIQTYFPKIEQIDSTDSIFSAIPIIEEKNPNLIFLDIQMPTANGLELFKLLKNRDPAVIITTAYDDYAIEAIKHSVLDYLLKPIDIQEFIAAVNNAIAHNSNSNNVTKFESKKIALHGQLEINYVNEIDIKYIISDRAYSSVHTEDGSVYVVTKSLNDFENILDESGFFRIHRSYIINLNKIARIIKKDGGHVQMLDDKVFKIANQKREILISKM